MSRCEYEQNERLRALATRLVEQPESIGACDREEIANEIFMSLDDPRPAEPTLNEIARRSHETSKAKGWWEGKLDPPSDRSFIPEKLMLIVSEAAEALESHRNGEPLSHYACTDVHGEIGPGPCPIRPSIHHKPEGMASELADIVIRVGDLAARLDIDLGRAVEEKHAYNLRRSFRHGGKVC